MEVFTLLKIIAQVLGVFPFKQKRIFYISKLYLAVNIFVGFFLLLSAVLFVVVILIDDNWESEKLENLNSSWVYLVERMTTVIIFGRIIVSLTAVITKFMWRREHIEILNTIFQFHREHRLNSILNTTTMSDYFFIAALSLPLAVEIFSTINDIHFNKNRLFYLAPIVKFQIILDEIMFCVVCSALSKYQHAIKQMISSLAIAEEAQGIARDGAGISGTDIAGDSFQSQLQQINVIERQVKHCYGRSVSLRAKKLEYLRKMNLKIFNIYSDYSALHQYQLFLSTTVSITEIIDLIFAAVAVLTHNINFGSSNITFQLAKTFSHLVSNLFRVFMLCYYNDKAFTEGISIKYIVQEIRRTSDDKDFMRVSKIFIDQLHNREQFQICGVFAYNMTLPVMFMGYSISYVVVLVQYLGLKM